MCYLKAPVVGAELAGKLFMRCFRAGLICAGVVAISSLAHADPLAVPAASPTPTVAAPAPNVPMSPDTGKRTVQMRQNLLTGGNLQAGSIIDYRSSTRHPEAPIVPGQRDNTSVEMGGYVGYQFADPLWSLPSSLGVDVQLGSDPLTAGGNWFLQPGLDYALPVAPSLQLSTRLFSTYATEASDPAIRQSLRSDPNAPSGFRDVGVGLGLGYSVSEKWNIQTQARYQRMLGTTDVDRDRETTPHEFFGGVMLDYKF